MDEHIWKRLIPSGTIPCARAAHAACSPENNKLYIYGGAIESGALAPDIIYCLDLTNGMNSCYWMELITSGLTPGKRYGHSMTYFHPYIFIFGGNLGSSLSNDIWSINIEDYTRLEWVKIDQEGECPPPRMYHSFNTCFYGLAKGMLIVFGGRGDNNQPTNDIWGFRRHRNGKWDWTKAPENLQFGPMRRFQVLFLFSILQFFSIIF